MSSSACLSTFVKTLRMVLRLLMSIIGLRACAASRASLGVLHHPPPATSVAPAPAPAPPAPVLPAAAAAAAGAVVLEKALFAAKAADTISNKCAIASTVKAKCHFLSLKAKKQEKKKKMKQKTTKAEKK